MIMGYRIMNKELTAYSMEGPHCIMDYDISKKYILSKSSLSYGDVLVETKRVFSGLSIKVKIFWKNHWWWKPEFYWKYEVYYFHWLFFMIWFEREYVDQFDKIIKDHLSESK